MKILQDNSHDANYIGDVQENRVGIDRNNIDFITTLLTSNLYSKPLESFLRETVANAWDSHIEADSDEYILLVITRTEYSKYTISVRDYGVGLSPERFDQIYKNIGSSTKRDSNDYIGAFGIGRFAGLSCADVVNINSYYNGIKYSYLMYKNGSGINIDKLSEVHDSSFKNGLEVVVSLSAYERDFIKAFERLILFEKLHIEFIDKYSVISRYNSNYALKESVVNFNNRKIIHFKTFSISKYGISLFNDRALKVGNILYSNDDWGDFKTSGILVNIPIGEVDITPNREELQFTERTKQVIEKYILEVKREFQEIVNTIQSNDFTLKEFYEYATGDYLKYNKDGLELSIHKRDVLLGVNTNLTIKGEVIPQNFISFIKNLSVKEINNEFIYKIYNPGKYYRYRRIMRNNTFFNCILDEEAYLGYKKDKMIKAVTSQYFEDTIKDETVVVVYDLEELKTSIKKYLTGKNAADPYTDKCIEYLFNRLFIYTLSNDSVPQAYIDNYKSSKKKKNTIVNNDVYVRRYFCDSYSTMLFKDINSSKGGLIIYSANTREDANIRSLSKFLEPLSSAYLITLKKEHFYLIENNKKFILLEDFLSFQNKILKKIVTAGIIARNFKKLRSLLEFSFGELPIVKEFYEKYADYEISYNRIMNSNGEIKSLIEKYEAKGWYNKADVKYFGVSQSGEEAVATMISMEEHKNDIVKSMAFFMFGRNDKLGVKIPKINICKYLKKFKYECI